MRHVVICRQREDAPESFTIANRTSGEDGWQWAEVQGLVSRFESLIRHVIAEVGKAVGEAMPAITITTRSLQSVLEQPPLDDQAKILTDQLNTGLVALMPIRLEQPTRSRYEMWAQVSRHKHGLTGQPLLSAVNVSPNIFIARLWADRLLDQFNAGETVQGFAGATFRQFAQLPAWQRREIWVRPSWEAINLLPETFEQKKPAPVFDRFAHLTPEQQEGAARAQEVIRQKRHVKGQWQSRGYSFNRATQAWTPPKS